MQPIIGQHLNTPSLLNTSSNNQAEGHTLQQATSQPTMWHFSSDATDPQQALLLQPNAVSPEHEGKLTPQMENAHLREQLSDANKKIDYLQKRLAVSEAAKSKIMLQHFKRIWSEPLIPVVHSKDASTQTTPEVLDLAAKPVTQATPAPMRRISSLLNPAATEWQPPPWLANDSKSP